MRAHALRVCKERSKKWITLTRSWLFPCSSGKWLQRLRLQLLGSLFYSVLHYGQAWNPGGIVAVEEQLAPSAVSEGTVLLYLPRGTKRVRLTPSENLFLQKEKKKLFQSKKLIH